MKVVVNSPDFEYERYSGAELSSVTFTFDVDVNSTLYKYMKSRLRGKCCEIIIRVCD